MKICILSDSHDHRELLANAIKDARAKGAEAVLHCGDVVSPSTLHVVREFNLPVHVIYGNNVGDLYYMSKLAADPRNLIHFHGQDAALTLHGRRIFMVHYPHYARAMALTGDFDLVCHGHDHRAAVTEIETIQKTRAWLVSPGTVGGVSAKATYVLGNLERMTFVSHDVPLREMLIKAVIPAKAGIQ